jgi:hypothetical protein
MIIDDKGQTLAKRLVYNEPPSIILSIQTEKSVYPLRDSVRINISATDSEGNLVESDIMISVVKSFSVSRSNDQLNSIAQLPGPTATVYRSASASINDQLIFYTIDEDFIAKNDVNEHNPVYLPEYEGHIISGSIFSSVTGRPLANENIVLSFVGKSSLCRFTKTDDEGRFLFIISESGRNEIVIQPFRPELSDYYVELRNPFPEALNKYKPEPLFIDTAALSEINNAIISMQIQDLYKSLESSGVSAPEQSYFPDFYGEPDFEMRLATYIELSSLKEVIKELVPGLFTFTRKDTSFFSLIYSLEEASSSTNPFVLVDGVPVNDHNAVLKINPEEIEQIKVLNTKFFIQDIVLEGIVDFTTIQGNLNTPVLGIPVFRQEFEALQPASLFYSPEYSSASQKESRIPDFRNTLYWNPNVRTDKSGTAKVDFFTSDEAGNYDILIEGFTSEGFKGSARSVISVRNK